MSLFQEIYSVFFEEKSIEKIDISPKSYIDIYRHELGEVFVDEIIVATKYENIHTKLERYKYQSERYLEKDFAAIFEEIFFNLDNVSTKIDMSKLCRSSTIISTIPMHWSRFLIRGFDHMSNIAKIFAKNIDIKNEQLLKTRFTKRQAKLSRKQRLQNRENIFFPRKKLQKIPEIVILLDDVISSGATINSCAKVLKNM